MNPKILFLKGLPASGKSTFAKELVAKEPGKWVRVNKDCLRLMLHDGEWSKGREKIVQQRHRDMVIGGLQSGLSIIVDDTNFSPRHEITYRDIALKAGADFVIKTFDTSVDECIERDRKRTDSVGKDVILRMFYQFQCQKKPEKIEGAYSAVIFDIDGTLALMNGRGAFEWDKVGTDLINRPVVRALEAFAEIGYRILLVSGRDGCCELETRKWLHEASIDYDELWMRPAGNKEKDTIIKRRIYDEHIAGKYNILAVFDDRPSVIRMWRQLGLFVFDCGNGIEF